MIFGISKCLLYIYKFLSDVIFTGLVTNPLSEKYSLKFHTYAHNLLFTVIASYIMCLYACENAVMFIELGVVDGRFV